MALPVSHRRDGVGRDRYLTEEKDVAWSTREIAQLAGTSLRAVRHYHEVGLLEQPQRRDNGYKQYGVAHLVRVLRIKRLADLGFSLSQIAAMGDADDHPEDALRTLDAELAATIERLRRTRVELGLILRQSTPTDLPTDFTAANAVGNLPHADRSFVIVLTRVLGPQTLRAWADMLQEPVVNPVTAQFTDLPADADEQTRAGVAERMVPHVHALYAAHPGLGITNSGTPYSARFVEQAVIDALQELCNPAQMDVLRRLSLLLSDQYASNDTERE
ncbi:MerR family transcriptional regulator [Streptosporangium sp. NPDC002524]|uniref:helix-turn-helix domain-containing protein n=1 Tax=Streptosporangium sp. NPDC002524 TaxID=3154537 RepID=UPI00332CAEFC